MPPPAKNLVSVSSKQTLQCIESSKLAWPQHMAIPVDKRQGDKGFWDPRASSRDLEGEVNAKSQAPCPPLPFFRGLFKPTAKAALLLQAMHFLRWDSLSQIGVGFG